MMQHEQMIVMAVILIIAGIFMAFFFRAKPPVLPDPAKVVNYEKAMEHYHKTKDVVDYANRSFKIGGGVIAVVSSIWLYFLWTMPFVEVDNRKTDGKENKRLEK